MEKESWGMSASQTTCYRNLLAAVGIVISLAVLLSVPALGRAGDETTPNGGQEVGERSAVKEVPSASHQDPATSQPVAASPLPALEQASEEQLRLLLIAATVMAGSPYGIGQTQTTTTGGASSPPTGSSNPPATNPPSGNPPDTVFNPPGIIVQSPSPLPHFSTQPGLTATGTSSSQETPEPSSMLMGLIGSGMAGLASLVRRRRKTKEPESPPEDQTLAWVP
jgi:hypothetical protein